MKYDKLEPMMHISILSFMLNEEDGFYSIIELRNRITGRLYSDKLSLRVVELKKLDSATQEEKETEVYQWARMLSTDDWEVLVKMAERNEYMHAAVEEMERINTQQGLRYLYLQREKQLHDEATLKSYYIREGEEAGVKRGLEKGMSQGMSQAKKIIRLIKSQTSLEEIILETGCEEEEILQMKALIFD